MTVRESEVLNVAVQIILTELSPSRILLFGSRATGRHHAGSDFDLAVDGPKPSLEREREIKEAVNESSGLFKVDIVYLPAVEKDFRDIISQTGKVIYEKGS